MKPLLNLALVLLASFSLMACSYFGDDEELSLDSTPPEVIDLTQDSPDEMPPDTINGANLVQPQRFEPPPRIEDVISDSTDGSVDIYPAAGGPALQAQTDNKPVASTYTFGDADAKPVDTVSVVPAGAETPIIYSLDPSVEVFPLDGPVGKPGPPPALDKLNIINTGTGNSAVVYFDHDGTGLNDKDMADISALATNHRVARGIAVEGHASTESSIKDPVQRKIANLKVSMERAFSVARILIEKGVPAELISTIAYGETRPASNPAQSRRVEIRGLSGQ